MKTNLQGRFPCPRVDVGRRFPVVVYKVGDVVHSEPHLPPFRQGFVVQKTEQSMQRKHTNTQDKKISTLYSEA